MIPPSNVEHRALEHHKAEQAGVGSLMINVATNSQKIHALESQHEH